MDMNAQFVLSVISSAEFLSAFPMITEDHINAIRNKITEDSDQKYYKHYSIDKTSIPNGLSLINDELSLSNKWGTAATAKLHSFINKPKNIRYVPGLDKIYVTNGDTGLPLSEGVIPCCELDSNFNFKGYVGKVGTNLLLGQYNDAVDFVYSGTSQKYYIASKNQNIVHMYDGVTKQFISSLGDGTAGADGLKITKPVSIGFGLSLTYILCQEGQPTGATDDKGFVVAYDKTNAVHSIPLFYGINNGTGQIFEGEISNPKDLKVKSGNSVDIIYILNGTNEIGVFDSSTIQTNQKLKFLDIITIPSELGFKSLDLNRIEVDNDYLYAISDKLGKVIAIDLKTKNLVGTFGSLSDESSTLMDDTLGYFNGLSGICLINDKILVSEETNNRLQIFGKSIVKQNNFEIIYDPFSMPFQKELVDISYSFNSSPVEDVKIIDMSTGYEISVASAVLKKVSRFKVKLVINSKFFSRKNKSYKVEPIFILTEDNI